MAMTTSSSTSVKPAAQRRPFVATSGMLGLTAGFIKLGISLTDLFIGHFLDRQLPIGRVACAVQPVLFVDEKPGFRRIVAKGGLHRPLFPANHVRLLVARR